MLTTTEETIEQAFNAAVNKENAVERVKKLRDYAFVHFRERDDALSAINVLNGMVHVPIYIVYIPRDAACVHNPFERPPILPDLYFWSQVTNLYLDECP